MRITAETAESVNLAFDEFPSDFDRSKFRQDVTEFAFRLGAEFSAEFKTDFSNQDCTFGAEIIFPNTLFDADKRPWPSIRVSNHQRLYVITVLRHLPEDFEDRIEHVAESVGFRYTPEHLFGLPFDQRDRINGDLFNRLYDYI